MTDGNAIGSHNVFSKKPFPLHIRGPKALQPKKPTHSGTPRITSEAPSKKPQANCGICSIRATLLVSANVTFTSPAPGKVCLWGLSLYLLFKTLFEIWGIIFLHISPCTKIRLCSKAMLAVFKIRLSSKCKGFLKSVCHAVDRVVSKMSKNHRFAFQCH